MEAEYHNFINCSLKIPCFNIKEILDIRHMIQGMELDERAQVKQVLILQNIDRCVKHVFTQGTQGCVPDEYDICYRE
jgi:hypothetical protein